MASILRSLSKRFKSKSSSTSPQYDPARQILCKVILLDGSNLNVVLDRKALGQDACNKVFVHLDLEETDYFGLTYTDHDNIQHWLDPVKKIKKQVPKGRCATFQFQVKFFSSDPSNLREEFTRYLFFLQIKADIKSGKLICSKESAIQLAALQLQSEFGDYNPTEHNEAFVSEFRFYNQQDEQMEIEILKRYKTLAGISPAEAERQYLDVAKMLQFYGVDLHDVVAKDGNNYRLGLTPTGVVVFDKENLVGVLFWQFIQAVNFSNRRLTVVLDEHSSNEIQQHTFVFSLQSNRACKRMWKRAVEFHTFYRMRSHRPAKRSATEQFFRLSSSYQHRGRTEFENVNQPIRRERSVVKFERKPSQRYGPRQSHVQRLRNEQLMSEQKKPSKALNDTANILEESNVLFNNSVTSELDQTNSSTIPANRTYTVTSPIKQVDTTISDGKNTVNTIAQVHPVQQSTNGIKVASLSDTYIGRSSESNTETDQISPNGNDKSVSASAIQANSKIPRFGNKAKPNIAGPRIYEQPAEADENNETKIQSKAPKTTFIPIIHNNRISNPKVITQL